LAFDRPLISIRERRQIDLFDLALVVIRRRPGTLALATVGGIAPFVAFNAWLFGRLGDSAPIVSLVLWWLEAPIALAPLTLALGGLMFGRNPSPRTVARQWAASLPTLGWTHGVLRFIPAYWLPPRLVFANEIVLLERAGWLKLWKRGGNLVGGREGDLGILAILEFGATLICAMIADLGVGRLVQSVAAERMTWDLPDSSALTTLAYQIPIWLGVAYFTVVRFLTYIDQRIRLEGWEVELRLRTAGEAMAEARRW